MAAEPKMTKLPFSIHFVLVHGASHGGWCWYKIRCLLESIEQKVSCPDLASSGIDSVDPNTIVTFEEYNKPLHDFFASLPTGEKVILVGHSAGGHNLTDVIHKFPQKIQVAVFVGAVMLRNGFMTDEDIKYGAPDLTKYGDVSDNTYGEGRDNPPTSSILKKEVQREILYQKSPLEVTTTNKLVHSPAIPSPKSSAILPPPNSQFLPPFFSKLAHFLQFRHSSPNSSSIPPFSSSFVSYLSPNLNPYSIWPPNCFAQQQISLLRHSHLLQILDSTTKSTTQFVLNPSTNKLH